MSNKRRRETFLRSGLAILASVLLLAFPVLAEINDYATDSVATGKFAPSEQFKAFDRDLYGSDFSNYADVDLVNSELAEVVIVQSNPASAGVNKAKVTQRLSYHSRAYISQSGSSNTAYIAQEGRDNTAMLVQQGYGHKGEISQTGDGNLALLVQRGADSEIGIDQVGNSNTAVVVDFAGSDYGITQHGNHGQISIISSMNRNVSVQQQ